MTSEEVRDFYRIITRLFSQTASSLDSRSLMRILRVVRVGEESELKTKEKRLLAALSEIHPTCRDHAWSKIWRNHRSTDLEQVEEERVEVLLHWMETEMSLWLATEQRLRPRTNSVKIFSILHFFPFFHKFCIFPTT